MLTGVAEGTLPFLEMVAHRELESLSPCLKGKCSSPIKLMGARTGTRGENRTHLRLRVKQVDSPEAYAGMKTQAHLFILVMALQHRYATRAGLGTAP